LLIEKGRFAQSDWQAGVQRVTFSLVARYGLTGRPVRSKVKTTTWFAKTTSTFVKTTSWFDKTATTISTLRGQQVNKSKGRKGQKGVLENFLN